MLYIDCFRCKYSFYVALLEKYRKIKKFGDFRKKIFFIFWGFFEVTFPGSTRDFTKNGKIPGKKKLKSKKTLVDMLYVYQTYITLIYHAITLHICILHR